MPDAAVPQAVAEALGKARPMPGHVFSLYLPFWDRNKNWKEFEHEELKEKAKIWALLACAGIDHKRSETIKKRRYEISTPNPKGNIDESLLNSLLKRQKALAGSLSAETITATSLSPFVTGMGEEHAVENGFAFLSPYGLPYLAGSGVKGVIRRAAEELAQGLNPQGTFGWTHTRVMWLFGFDYENKKGILGTLEKERKHSTEEICQESNKLLEYFDKEAKSFSKLNENDCHFKGALSFWDVIIKGKLGIDILTPHYGHYYQGEEPPHDAGQPVPNPFLVVKPDATFTFHITCNERHLPDSLKGQTWRQLIQAAFDHAFTWAGFGAKTAAGYGVLTRGMPQKASSTPNKPSGTRPGQTLPPAMTAGSRVIDQNGETGFIKEIRGDKALVDFDGFEEEVPLSELKSID